MVFATLYGQLLLVTKLPVQVFALLEYLSAVLLKSVDLLATDN